MQPSSPLELRASGSHASGALIDAGMHVLIVDADAKAGREAVAPLGNRAQFIDGNVSDGRLISDAANAAAGLGRGLRGIVSNVGIMIRKPVTKLSLAEWNRVLATQSEPAFPLDK